MNLDAANVTASNIARDLVVGCFAANKFTGPQASNPEEMGKSIATVFNIVFKEVRKQLDS